MINIIENTNIYHCIIFGNIFKKYYLLILDKLL